MSMTNPGRTPSKRDGERHWRAMRISAMLRDSYRELNRPDVARVRPQHVIGILRQAGVGFAVIGTHGFNGYRDEPRATQDVDLLIRKRDQRKAAAVVGGKYRNLIREDTSEATRWIDPATDLVAIDLWRPFCPLLRLTFRNTIWVRDVFKVPNLEMALVARFAVMISPRRELSKQYLDAGDFINVYLHNQDEVDEGKLEGLADSVGDGGSAKIRQYLEDAKADRMFKFPTRVAAG